VRRRRSILAEILEGVPDDEEAKPAPGHDPGNAGGNTARVYNLDVVRRPPLLEHIKSASIPLRRDRRKRA
jgi:hypothetical protein